MLNRMMLLSQFRSQKFNPDALMCIADEFSKRFSVVNQYYEAEVVSEYVIRGNTAVLKCNIPSFVADFVRVEAWVGNDNRVFTYSDEYGILN